MHMLKQACMCLEHTTMSATPLRDSTAGSETTTLAGGMQAPPCRLAVPAANSSPAHWVSHFHSRSCCLQGRGSGSEQRVTLHTPVSCSQLAEECTAP